MQRVERNVDTPVLLIEIIENRLSFIRFDSIPRKSLEGIFNQLFVEEEIRKEGVGG